jgi:hypothetical protein
MPDTETPGGRPCPGRMAREDDAPRQRLRVRAPPCPALCAVAAVAAAHGPAHARRASATGSITERLDIDADLMKRCGEGAGHAGSVPAFVAKRAAEGHRP